MLRRCASAPLGDTKAVCVSLGDAKGVRVGLGDAKGVCIGSGRLCNMDVENTAAPTAHLGTQGQDGALQHFSCLLTREVSACKHSLGHVGAGSSVQNQPQHQHGLSALSELATEEACFGRTHQCHCCPQPSCDPRNVLAQGPSSDTLFPPRH